MVSPTSGLKDRLGGVWSGKFILSASKTNNGTPISLKTELSDAVDIIATSVPLGGSEYSIFNLIYSSPPESGLFNKFVIEWNQAESVFPPLLSIVMLGAIFFVKQAGSLTGERGFEFDLILLASCLVVIVAGPGRVSISHVIKKLPRWLH